MRPIFTVHAGEYLVGSHIEQSLQDSHGNKPHVWIPSKDTGVDLLVTNHDNKKTVSIQVKFSKDFLVTHGTPEYIDKLISCGWWTLNRDKIQASPADYWVFVLHTFNQKNTQYVIITPDELKSRLDILHPDAKSLQTYLWVTASKICWETRGIKKNKINGIVSGTYNEHDKDTRNFTLFLNNWDEMMKRIS